jgi:hypothetical protein
MLIMLVHIIYNNITYKLHLFTLYTRKQESKQKMKWSKLLMVLWQMTRPILR